MVTISINLSASELNDMQRIARILQRSQRGQANEDDVNTFARIREKTASAALHACLSGIERNQAQAAPALRVAGGAE